MKNFTKSLLLACCSLLMIHQMATAQVNIMSFSQSSGTYTEITGGVVYGNETTDDQRFVDPAVPLGGTVLTGPGLPIGFDFTINGETFDRLAINANGWISLGKSSLSPAVNITSTSSYTPLSSTSVVSPTYLRTRIAAFGADLQAQVGASLRLETIGSAPNRVCVVQWKNYRRYNQTGMSLNFQIRLNEGTNVVEIVYGSITANATNNAAHVGIGGSVPTDFINRMTTAPHDWTATVAGTANTSTCTLVNTGTVPPSGLTFTFNPPAGCTGTPSAGTASGPAGACSGVAFNVVLSGYTLASGITLQWQSSPAGAGTWTNIAGATSATQSVTQTSATDYRCIVTCTNSNQSAVSNVVSVTMNNFTDCYCSSIASNATDEDLGNVTVGALDNTSTCASVGPGPGSIQNRYSNYKTLPPTDVMIGSTVNFSLTSITCGGNYGNKFALYIDWNRDGDFLDANEELFDGGHAVGPHTATGSFVVPVSAQTGVTGMRVLNVETGATTNLTPCMTYSWGETEDYLVNIIPPPPCVGTPNPGTIGGPLTVCPGSSTTLTLTGYSAGTGLEFQWQSSSDGVNYSDIPGATGTSYTTPALNANTWYQVVVTCVPSSSSATTTPVQVQVSNPVGGTITGPTTLTAGIAGNYTVTGFVGNIQWQVSSDGGNTFTNISGATNPTQSLLSNSTGTFHLRVAASLPGCPTSFSNVLIITVTAPPNDDVCNAITIPVDGTNYGPYSNFATGVQTGEPVPPAGPCAGPLSWCISSLQHTVWFKFVAPASKTVKIESFRVTGSTDNQLAVYAAADCNAILNNGSTLLAANDDANSGGNAFTAAINYLSCLTPGQTYFIQMDAYSLNAPGTYNLKITEISPNITLGFSGLPSSMCILDNPVTLTPASTPGTFSGPGITGDVFNPLSAGLGTHTITYTPSSFSNSCHTSTQTVQVTGVALYPDNDGDGYGQLNDPTYICLGDPIPPGFAPNADDCDDSNPNINPGQMVDICGNGIDENCDGEDNSIFDFSLTIIPDCKGTTKNKITVSSIVGGVPPFTYSRNGGPFQSSPTFNNVPAGTHTITVKGSDGCERTESVTLNPPMSISGVVTNTTCAGFADGSIDLTVTDGYPGYTFSWSNGSTDEDIFNLAAGTYKATITDAMGCSAKFTGKVTSPKPIKIKLTVTNVSCNGGSDGAILNTVTGGTGSFTYAWSDGSTTQNLSGVPANSYTVTVTDLSNTACTATKTALVTEPSALGINGFTMKQPKCHGGNDGSLKVTAGGGTGTKTYAWSNGGNTQQINNLTAGTYTVTVTDANGCTVTGSHTVTQPAPLQITSITSAPNNSGSYDVTITATGGTPPYKASKDGINFGGMIIKKVSAGVYTFYVRDKNLCQTSMANVTIPTSPRPAAMVSSRNEQINQLHVVEATNFRLMPNPASTSVVMLFDGAFDTNGIVEVHTAAGRLVKRVNAGNLTQDGNSLRLEDLPSGILMVSFVSDNQRVTKRLVVLNK